jgi:hypothetical protein
MILCEIALGKIKRAGLNDNNDDGDATKPLDFEKFQSVNGIGQNVPDSQYTMARNYGLSD